MSAPIRMRVVGIAVLFASATASADNGLGFVSFPVECGDPARAHFVRGVLALHSFFYEQARTEFQAASNAEPACAMAYWGEAMSHDRTLWGTQDTADGRQALARAVALKAGLGPKNAAFVDAARALFGSDGDGSLRVARGRAYSAALHGMRERWPDDDEVAAFYALALMGAEDSAHPSLRDRMQAGALALEVLGRNPQHPGALHYAIHAFDDPDHAALALPAARTYAAIAPDAPHARHMPAHIFVELGQWAEAATACESAWQVSRAWAATHPGPGHSSGDVHSLSWLAPLYVEMGQWKRALVSLDTLARVVSSDVRATVPYVYSATAVMRDTNAWDHVETFVGPAVAALPALDAQYDRERGPEAPPMPAAVRALIAKARALSAAHRHDLGGARRLAAVLADEHARAARLAPTFVDEAYKAEDRLDELQVQAEIALASDQSAVARAALHEALRIEDTRAQTDGADPARASSYETLGALELNAGQYAQAADDFAHALSRAPGRSSTLLGAALAAEHMGQVARASDSWLALAHNWPHADADVPGLAELRSHLR